MDILKMKASEIVRAVTSGKLSARDVTEFYLRRAEKLDDKVHAFLWRDREWILARADKIDQKRARGERLGRLAGVPVALKDNLCTRGVPTTCASRILGNFRPPYDAHVVQRLQAEDAVIFGKTNLDEFAMGSSTENSSVGATRNPWDLDRVPGGSSGGSAVAVAARMAPLALGSDTGGSIRQPAALCGVIGVKPTYGRVSRYGLVAFASSLDQIGPFGTNVEDVALLLEIISGRDARDSTSADVAVPAFVEEMQQGGRALRIGVPKEYFGEGIDPEVEKCVRAAVDVYRQAGADIVDLSLPHTQYAVPCYYIVATAEASSNLARYDGVHYGYRAKDYEDMIDMYSKTRAEGFGAEVKRRIMLGTFALSSGYYDAYYLKASRVRNLIKQDFDRAFEQVDCVVCPVTPTPAFKLGEKTVDPLQMYLSDIFTIPANLAGIPGISVPCGFTKDALPVGLHIMAKHFDEVTMLRAASVFEKETNGAYNRVPDWVVADEEVSA